jgi:hypothetical protein
VSWSGAVGGEIAGRAHEGFCRRCGRLSLFVPWISASPSRRSCPLAEVISAWRARPLSSSGVGVAWIDEAAFVKTSDRAGNCRRVDQRAALKSPILASADTPGPVVVLALNRDPQSMANYHRLVASLRAAGITAELYLGSGGMKAQLKYADRRRSSVAVIQGGNERNAPGAGRWSRSAT